MTAAEDLHVDSHHPPQDLLGRCRALAEELPADHAFSHTTAMRIHGLPMSYAMEEDDRIHVVRPITRSRIKQPGVVGHRALHPRQITTASGVRVVDLADTWADLGEMIGRGRPVGLDDTIVAGDAIATRLGSRTPLALAVAARNRPRGKRTLIEGLEEVRVGSASPGETLSRIMLVRCGLPEPQLNVPIWSSTDPCRLLGVGDLVWHLRRQPPLKDIKVIGEYQGAAFHSSPAQRRHDRVRLRGFQRDGWQVEFIWNADLHTPEARQLTVARFASALELERDSLSLAACEPRFFSTYAMQLAEQRASFRLARSS
ncbi:hypothetical protein OO014_07895 [Intrasporangium calvum]|uniref:Uncharacterized protein n=1 Tax=Intrasporangium calvum TaxID=53358 RepID=A0ABT5GG02_9MICO|nr:hypothetical protein [Intrasporangium calvum]MDC5697178.1 hypothetical protein [Intrasporangium calvum]